MSGIGWDPVIHSSEKVAWTIDSVLGADARFDFGRPMLPDSLANVATNLGRPACAAAAPVYRRAIAYALRALSLPNVSVYLDAAHAGWLGWDGNRHAIARVFADVIAEAGVAPRGFALDVSGYDPLVVSGAPGDSLESRGDDDAAAFAAQALRHLEPVHKVLIAFLRRRRPC